MPRRKPSRSTSRTDRLNNRQSVRNLNIRPNRSLNTMSNRPSYLEGRAMQLVGHVNALPCTRCENGLGVFVECVSVPGEAGNGCASCHYESRGRDCSHHQNFVLRPGRGSGVQLPVTTDIGDRERAIENAKRKLIKSLEKEISQAEKRLGSLKQTLMNLKPDEDGQNEPFLYGDLDAEGYEDEEAAWTVSMKDENDTNDEDDANYDANYDDDEDQSEY